MTSETPPLPVPDSNCTDAMEWAESFVAHAQHYTTLSTDAGAMAGWFANAMQAMNSRVSDAYDRGRRDASALLAFDTPDPALDTCHCGRPVHVYEDGFTRHMCEPCSSVRCDTGERCPPRPL